MSSVLVLVICLKTAPHLCRTERVTLDVSEATCRATALFEAATLMSARPSYVLRRLMCMPGEEA